MAGDSRNRLIGVDATMQESSHAFPASGPSRRPLPYGAGKDRGVKLQPVEVVGFVHAKLSRMGLDGRNPYTPDAYRRIAERSEGYPASIDEICEASLRFASANRIGRISAAVVDAAMAPEPAGAEQPREAGAEQPRENAARLPETSVADHAGKPDRGSAMRVLERLHPEANRAASRTGRSMRHGHDPAPASDTRSLSRSDRVRGAESRPEAPNPKPRRIPVGAVAGYALVVAVTVGAVAAVPASSQRDFVSYVLDTTGVPVGGHPSTDDPSPRAGMLRAGLPAGRASPADGGFAAPELVAMALDPTDRLSTPLLVLLEPGDERVPRHLFILISGLPDGLVPSHGVDSGGTWQVEADELSSLEIRAGPDYAGPERIDIDIAAVADYGEGRQTTTGRTVSVGIRSTAASAAAPSGSGAIPVMHDDEAGRRKPAPAIDPVPTPSADMATGKRDGRREAPKPVAETAPHPSDALAIRRGNDLFARGDLAGARLFYERAVAGGSVEGALAMGRTHDPLVFERMRVLGLVPDPEQAMAWYRRAAGKGSQEAQEALRALAARDRHDGDPGNGAR